MERMIQLTPEALELQTIFELRIALGSRRRRKSAFVRLRHAGIQGFGDAPPSHYYGETYETVEAALAEWAPQLGDDPFALEAIERRLDAALQGQSAARAAVDM